VITLSTTHIAMIRSLDESGSIRGISGADLVYDTAMIRRIGEGEVIDVGYERTLNYELIVSLQPDVLFLYGVESSIREISDKLVEMGIPVVFCGDYLEEHPLGKAEWLRFFSLFFHRESEADSLFDRIDSSYRALTLMTDSLEERPSVLTGLPWKDTWYMAGGDSYAARLIEDAGGRFLWEDSQSSEAIPLNIESVFSRAVGADVWINPGAAASLKDLVRFDERFSSLGVVKQGRVYNNNARLNPSGGNDYWESGAVRPDLVLADMIKIFHPDLMEDHRFRYYRKLK
jgi:iron complex transport system substrate-binding protein